MGMGVGGGEAAAAVAVGEEGKEEGKGWRAKSKLSAAVGVALALSGVLVLHRSLRHNALVKAEEGIVCMCEERARMLQDQFAVSVNHVHALAILVATFHYEKQPPALDQLKEKWFDNAVDHEKFLGLDLEYTADQRGVAVIQLCFARHVLIFQWARSDKHCPELMDFLRSGITFATVDIRNDKLKMRHSFGIEIPAGCLVDLQTVFRLRHDRTSMAHMAVALIDEGYGDMKTSFPKYHHKLWEKGPLDPINIEYAAKDAYVSYELYRKIRVVNYGQRHLEEGGHSDSDE